MALPKEPRQKMINLMYLVLTALLALNVSSEILNAFKTVDNSLHNANNTIDGKNTALFTSFKSLENEETTKEKAILWGGRAAQAKQMADGLVTYIDDLKQQIKKAADLNDKGDYKEDNLEAATRIMTDPGTKGQELLNKLTSFKSGILGINDSIKTRFKDELPIDLSIPQGSNEGNNKSWSASYFNMTPAIAAVTILSKFQNDVKNSEAMVVDYCHQQVGAVKFVFDKYVPVVGQNATYLMPGQDLIIDAGIGSFNSKSTPQITVDGAPTQLMPDGRYEFKSTAPGPGSYTKNVHVTFFNQATGANEQADYPVKYVVGSPTGVTITPDAVKVLYIGLTNPISVTGGLKGAESNHVSISQGQVTDKGNGHYDITGLNTPGKATITVTGSDGKVTTSEMRVRTIPPPTAKVGSSGGGRMSANEFKAQLGVRADMGEFIFENVKYDVTSFTLIATGRGFEATGPQAVENSGAYFSSEAKRIIEMCKPGSSIILDRIKVVGPDGSKTLPGTIAFTLY